MVGIMTSSGVEATARNAYDYGYNVVLIADAMTDLSTGAHRHSVQTTFPRIGEVSNTNDVLTLLGQRETSITQRMALAARL